MNNYGKLECNGNENGITYEVYLDNDFKYTIVVRNGDIEDIRYHQGIRAIFGADIIDIQTVNNILDAMINEIQ